VATQPVVSMEPFVSIETIRVELSTRLEYRSEYDIRFGLEKIVTHLTEPSIPPIERDTGPYAHSKFLRTEGPSNFEMQNKHSFC
jgi:hypothetical protein